MPVPVCEFGLAGRSGGVTSGRSERGPREPARHEAVLDERGVPGALALPRRPSVLPPGDVGVHGAQLLDAPGVDADGGARAEGREGACLHNHPLLTMGSTRGS